jgi:chromosome segregation ATPase
MGSNFDATEFVDSDYQQSKSPFSSSTGALPSRAPTREEVDVKASEAQQKLVELKRAQEELERQRAELEDTRRRQSEFQTSRQEMLQNLERGIGLLEEVEFSARQEAEQTNNAVQGLRDALDKVEGLHEESWTADHFHRELTRALTTLENARMEWNTCRLKYPILSGDSQAAAGKATDGGAATPLADMSLGRACKLGLALTWPIALVGLAAIGLFAVLLMQR